VQVPPRQPEAQENPSQAAAVLQEHPHRIELDVRDHCQMLEQTEVGWL